MHIDDDKEHRLARNALADSIEAQVPGLVWDRPGGWPRFGGACPWQGEGLYEGREFYVRFRHNQASMTVYADPEHETELLAAVIWPYLTDPDPDSHEHAGTLRDEQIVPFLHALIEQLAPASEDNPSSQTILARTVEAMLAAMDVRPD